MDSFYVLSFMIAFSHFSAHAMHGGKPYSIEKVPYMCQLYNTFENEMVNCCGAAILSERWILTAAHCVKYNDSKTKLKNTQVRVGTNDTLDGGKLYNTTRIIKHDEHSFETRWNNDIALIELAVPIVFNNQSRPISISKNSPEIGDEVTISGYGYDKDEFVPYLQIGRQAVISHEACKTAYSNIPQANVTLDEKAFCVNSTTVDAGFGDSGSPIVLNEKIVGIAVEAGESPIPNIYVNVTHYYDWITNITSIKFN